MKFLKKWTLLLLVLVVFAVTLVAASENSDLVSLRFLGYGTPEWPVAWWMLAAFIGGALFAGVLAIFVNARLRLRYLGALREVERRTRELDRERTRTATTIEEDGEPMELAGTGEPLRS